MLNKKDSGTAVEAAGDAQKILEKCLDESKSFVFEAGAGSGKTYSLIEALKYLVDKKGLEFMSKGQHIACITYTERAVAEIEGRIDKNKCVHVSTIHAFSWNLIKPFQTDLISLIKSLNDKWTARSEGEEFTKVDYSQGYPYIKNGVAYLHHDDVIALTAIVLSKSKFRSVLASRFPVVLVDEYQDTNTDLVEAFKDYILSTNSKIILGFFGDHWQKIYAGCGLIEHENLVLIEKNSNFRSNQNVVDVLNAMRPSLQQSVSDDSRSGVTLLLHSNDWKGERRKGPHWAGDLPPEESDRYVNKIMAFLEREHGWDFNDIEETKILMLTQSVLAAKQGYPTIPTVFSRNEKFSKKEDPHISFLVDDLEVVIKLYHLKEYGKMMSLLKKRVDFTNPVKEKAEWAKFILELDELRSLGTVGEVIDFLIDSKKIGVPQSVLAKEMLLQHLSQGEETEERKKIEYLSLLRAVPYVEIIALTKYLNGYTPFSTNHGVKGEQYRDVLVVAGRGWNKFNFDKMIKWTAIPPPPDKVKGYEEGRNLFYVSCSRSKDNLVVFFSQLLSDESIDILKSWFGDSNVVSIDSIKS